MRWLVMVALLLLVQTAVAQRLYPVEKKRKWGYMNEDGKMVIDFKYDLAQNFNKGYAMVALNRMPCLINAQEKRIIDTGLYQFIGTYNEGLVPVMDYKFKRYYVDTNGKVVITLSADIYDAGTFYRGVARVSKKVIETQQRFGTDISNLTYKFAYINKKGEPLTAFDFDDCDDLNNYPARYMKGERFGLIDSNGKIITEPIFDNISEFSDGLAVVAINGKFGFINQQGVQVIKPIYDFARMFSNGLAAVEVNNKVGFINTKGEVVIPPTYDAVKPFGDNRCAVSMQGKWGFIDNKGTLIYNYQFEDAGVFNNGICPIKRNKRWGAIDFTGRIVVPFEFDFVGNFDNGIADVILNGVNLYVNAKGELLPKLNER
jgi:hypothetical protein